MKAGEGLLLAPSCHSPGKSRLYSHQTRPWGDCLPHPPPQLTFSAHPCFLAAQEQAEEAPCAGSRLCGTPRQHPKPAQEPFHPQPCLPPEAKLLPQDTPSRSAAKLPAADRRVLALGPGADTDTHSPFFAPRPRAQLSTGRQVCAAQCASLFAPAQGRLAGNGRESPPFPAGVLLHSPYK